MTLGRIIAAYRAKHGMSMEKFASLSGMSKAYVSILERNQTPRGDEPSPSYEIYKAVAKTMGIDVTELIRLVEGDAPSDPAKAAAAPTAERDIDPIYDALNIAGRQALCAYGRFLGSQTEYRAPEEPSAAPSRIIPLLGASFAAGTPETPGDLFIQDYATTDPHAEFAIRVNGNSMEPYLADGSIALGVKRAPRDGEVGAFWLDGGFLVKQVCQDHIGNTYLFSLNRDRADADETIWHDSDRDLRLIGTILMSQRLPLP